MRGSLPKNQEWINYLPFEKIWVKLEPFPKIRGENSKKSSKNTTQINDSPHLWITKVLEKTQRPLVFKAAQGRRHPSFPELSSPNVLHCNVSELPEDKRSVTVASLWPDRSGGLKPHGVATVFFQVRGIMNQNDWKPKQ